MASLRTVGFIIALNIIVIIILKGCCQCVDIEYNEDISIMKRHRNMSEATSSLYESLKAKSMSLESRCKRHIILLSMATKKGVPYESTVSQLSTLPEDIVDEHVRGIHIGRRVLLLMAAIDRYRVSKLEPPFFELLECLKQIKLPQVEVYLEDRELALVISLYRQILESPDVKIDLEQINTYDLHPAFCKTLEIIFRGHLKDEAKHSDADARREEEGESSGAPQSSLAQLLQVGRAERRKMSAEEQRELILQKKRIRERERRRNRRGDDWHRHREGERLRQRRLRLMETTTQQQGRLRQQRRRFKSLVEGRTDRQKRLDEQLGEYLQRQLKRKYSSGPVSEHMTTPPDPVASMDHSSSERQQLERLFDDEFILRSLILPPSSNQKSSEQMAPGSSDSQSRQKQIRLEQPQPSTMFPRSAPDTTVQDSHSSLYPHQIDLNLDQTTQDMGEPQRKNGDEVQTNYPVPPEVEGQISGHYKYVTDSGLRGAWSPSIMSDWHVPGAVVDQSNSLSDLTSVASRLEDTEAVVESFSNPAQQTEKKDDNEWPGTGILSDMDDPWDDFDRELARKNGDQ